MAYEIKREGIEIAAYRNGEKRAHVNLHEAPGILYAADLESCGDPGALLAVIRYVTKIARETCVMLHVDASSPAALRLCRLYATIGTLEYLSFRVN